MQFSSVETILITVLVILIIFVICGFWFYLITHNNKRLALSSLLEIDRKLKQIKPIEVDSNLEISTLFYPDELYSQIIELPFPFYRLENSLVLVESYLDFSKRKHIDPLPGQNTTLSINSNKITFELEGISYDINIKDIFYLKGYFEYKRNALFIEFVGYKNNWPWKFQILSLQELVNLSSQISNNHTK